MRLRFLLKQSTRTSFALAFLAALLCGCAILSGCAQSSASSSDVQNKLEEYANLVITKGLNVQKGDNVAVLSTVETADFARMCIDKAYAAGADDVLVYWSDSKADQSRLLNASEEVLATAPKEYAAFYEECLEKKASYLSIRSPEPNSNDGVSAERIALDSQAKSKESDEYTTKRHNNEIPWIVCGYPNTAWAETVFPDKKGDAAVSALLDAILETVYVTGDGSSIQTWNEHAKELTNKASQLNSYNFTSLHYQNSLGTDLTVQMPEGHLWTAAEESTQDGRTFIANMPTEEVFSAPQKTGVNGTLVTSMPLVLDGQVIKDMKFTIKDGKIIEATASQGQDVLNAALDADEGSRYLGEISLVPYNSPISQSGILYYCTLYDENASCHFAFGSSYASCFAGGLTMTEAQLLASGLNQSSKHVDFMVGTSDLSITGITHDGTEVVVFKDGNFAF